MIRTKEEKTAQQREAEEKKRREDEKLRGLFEKYDLDTTGWTVLTPKQELLDAGWNKHTLFPVTADDTVYMHPDQTGVSVGSVRVAYWQATHVATLSYSHFEKLSDVE